MPDRNAELSVFRVTDLSNEQIWEIGQVNVSEPQGKKLWGRGDVSAHTVLEADLTIILDDKPPGHANIVDWPQEKSAQKLIAMELAKQATLVIKFD